VFELVGLVEMMIVVTSNWENRSRLVFAVLENRMLEPVHID
jgi:hypothetical protein